MTTSGAKGLKLLGEAYITARRGVQEPVNVVTEQTPGAGLEENERLDSVLKDFSVDVKNKTKVIEFLISLSNKNNTAAFSTMQPAASKPTGQISTMKPGNTANYLPRQ
jgi:hypothetical protein